jgi:hypothetical protein
MPLPTVSATLPRVFNFPTITTIHVRNTDTWTEELKDLANGSNYECPITMELIGEYYCTCLRCRKNFDHDALKTHLSTARHKCCPMCRESWTNNVKYKRITLSIPMEIEPIVNTNFRGSRETSEWPIVKKELESNSNVECPISNGNIERYYSTCLACNKNFDYELIHRWTTKTNNTCPML